MKCSYLLPIRREQAVADPDLDAYIAWLAGITELIIVDASPEPVFEEHSRRWRAATHLRPEPGLQVRNGKVWGVLTGLQAAGHEYIVIGDDDVRYDDTTLASVLTLLNTADIVRPQNYFTNQSWHTIWDTGRTLLNRLWGGDWPGTLAVRRSMLQRTDGYDGDCLFENLELVRTVVAAGGVEAVAADVFVARRPPTSHHFFSQRIRQAYDEFARPGRLLFQASWLPILAGLALLKPRTLLAPAALVVCLAEAGRRRQGGASVFPFVASLAAPIWVMERALAIWLAMLSRLIWGGVRYRGRIIETAAHSDAELSRRHRIEVQS